MIWCVAWLWFSFEKPSMHPTITDEERIYIETSIGETSPLVGKVRTHTHTHTIALLLQNLFFQKFLEKTQKIRNFPKK